MRKIKISALSVCGLAILVCGGLAYKYGGVHWNLPTMKYFINNGIPAGWISPVKAGAITWTNAGSKFVFVYKGRTAKGVSWTAPKIDRVNVITRGALDPTQYPNVLALTYTWYYTGSGEIIDSDIIFNTRFPWVTNGAATGYDVQNIGTHELGHCLQLLDLYRAVDREKTMYGYASKGEVKKRTLTADDKAGIKFIYGVK